MRSAEERIDQLELEVSSLRSRLATLEGMRAPTPPPRPAPTPVAPPRAAAPATPASRPAPAGPATSWSPPPSRPQRPAKPAFDLEGLLTGKVLGWAGAIAVLAGILFFLVTAINRGWIDEPTRVALAYLASTGLLAGGMFMHDRRGAGVGAAMVSAAIAALFASTTAATTLYDLITPETGLFAAALIGAVGTAIAVRWESRDIAAIGILGALLSPVLVGSGTSDASLLLMGVAMLSATGVLIWMRWDWLAVAAFTVSVPQLLAWLWASDAPELGLALSVLGAFWLVYLVAAIGFELRVPSTDLRASSAMLLLADALLIAGAGWEKLADAGHDDAATAWVISLAVVHCGIGAGIFGRRVSKEISLLVGAVGIGLSAVGLAMALEGPALVASWAAEAAVLAWLGSRLDDRRVDITAAVFLLGSALYAVAFETPVESLGGAADASALAAIAIVSVAGAAVAALSTWLRDLAGIVMLAAIAYFVPVAVDGVWVPVLWALLAVLATEVAVQRPAVLERIAAVPFIALALVHALIYEAPLQSLWDGSDQLLDALIALVAVAGAGYAMLLHESSERRDALLPAVAGVLIYAGSVAVVEVFAGADGPGQTSQLLLSVFWAAIGLGGLIAGLSTEQRRLRIGGLSFLALAAVKVTIYDLSELDEIYRVLSFIGLGLLLLAGAYAEQQLKGRGEVER